DRGAGQRAGRGADCCRAGGRRRSGTAPGSGRAAGTRPGPRPGTARVGEARLAAQRSPAAFLRASDERNLACRGPRDGRRSGGVPAERLRVLLVDDNASVLRFLASAFSSNGCQVTTAGTAEQALEQLSDDPFDLVVSDIKMPGLSGLDLLRAVKGKQPGTPVVLITGNPSVNSAVFGLRHGAYDYLPKPFSIREIQQLLARVRSDRQKWDGQV